MKKYYEIKVRITSDKGFRNYRGIAAAENATEAKIDSEEFLKKSLKEKSPEVEFTVKATGAKEIGSDFLVNNEKKVKK